MLRSFIIFLINIMLTIYFSIKLKQFKIEETISNVKQEILQWVLCKEKNKHERERHTR